MRFWDSLNKNPIHFVDVLCGSRENAPKSPQLLQVAVTEPELMFVHQKQ
jgi:hypothetical protein